jgi:hypothetical protein
MNVLVELLLVSCFLLLVAVALITLGMVGLAFRWVVQVWSGGGSHRPYDRDSTVALDVSARRQGTEVIDL